MDKCSSKYDIPYTRQIADLDLHCKHNRLDKPADRWRSLFYCLFMTICLSTCIVTCISSVYCGQALLEVKQLKQDIVTLNHDSYANGHRSEELRGTPEEGIDDEDGDYDGVDDDEEEEEDENDMTEFLNESEDSDIEVEDVENDTELEEIDGSGDEEDLENDDEDNYKRKRRSPDVTTRKPKRSRGGKRKLKKPKPGQKKGKGKMRYLKSAHFTASVTDALIDRTIGQYDAWENTDCGHVEEMKGTLCRNKTFIPDNKYQAIHLTHAANWVKEKDSPVEAKSSVFVAKAKGVHMVYSQILFGGNQASKSASIVQKRGDLKVGAFTCNTGVHVFHSTEASTQEQTCNIMGLVHLQVGDTLEVQNNDNYLNIQMDGGATYFGIVQLNNK